ncbi:hypothetical protein GCM10023187_10560 [Nibrella viscosa]|uniref:histidine kinase n=1 Tax=Nibrella viscosa TaxID=1084524 RepID=A0ABP8K279_9BACT
MRRIIPLLLICWLTISAGQAQPVLRIDSLPAKGILLDKGWKWQAGDNPAWATPEFDDSSWESIDPTKDFYDLPEVKESGLGWFRLRLSVVQALANEPLVVMVSQMGASEIYLNGKQIYRFGQVSSDQDKVQTYNPLGQPMALPLSTGTEQVLAVRFSFKKSLPQFRYGERTNPLLIIRLNKTNQETASFFASKLEPLLADFIKLGFFLLLTILHLGLYWHAPKRKANLYFLLFAASMLFTRILYVIALLTTSVDLRFYLLATVLSLYGLPLLCSLAAIYALFNIPKGLIFWLVITVCLVYTPLPFFIYEVSIWFLPIAIHIDSARVALVAVLKKKQGAWFIATGALIYVISRSLGTLTYMGYVPQGPYRVYTHLFMNVAYLSIPVAMSLFLSLEFAWAYRQLSLKLQEVEDLSAKTLVQEQEKQQLLAQQNETLEQKVTERTTQLQQSLDTLKATQNQLIQKEKMASLGELTAGIAHEIQNPLNFVNNFAEVSVEMADELQQSVEVGDLAAVTDLSAELKENMSYIVDNGKRAAAIVRSMLEHSRSSSGERRPTNLNELADEYLKLAYHGMRAQDPDFQVRLCTQFDDELKPVTLAPQDMGRVLLNLYNNAFYAVRQKQRQIPKMVAGTGEEAESDYQPIVWVSTQQVNGYFELRVKDNGTGIPEEIISKIYQPFFTTKPTGQGTGLGLSLSYDIVTKGHGGEMALESEVGAGSTFTVKIPG